MMSELALAVAMFLAFHLIPSSPLRDWMVESWGERAYLLVFSLGSTALLVVTIWAFTLAPAGPKLWYPPSAWYFIHAALVLAGIIFIAAGVMSPNPSAIGQEDSLAREDIATGITAITRHPVMWGLAFWALAHLISQSNWRGLLFFGSFFALALIGGWAIDRRKARALGERWEGFKARTSFVPFVAILAGRNRLSLRAIGWRPLMAGVLIWAAILYVHPWLFGVSPLPMLGPIGS